MAKCECCDENEANAAILVWADDPRYGMQDLRGAMISIGCLMGSYSIEVKTTAMGHRIRARRKLKAEAVSEDKKDKTLYTGNDLELDRSIAMKMASQPSTRKPYFRPEPKEKPAVVHVWPEHWETPSWES